MNIKVASHWLAGPFGIQPMRSENKRRQPLFVLYFSSRPVHKSAPPTDQYADCVKMDPFVSRGLESGQGQFLSGVKILFLTFLCWVRVISHQSIFANMWCTVCHALFYSAVIISQCGRFFFFCLFFFAIWYKCLVFHIMLLSLKLPSHAHTLTNKVFLNLNLSQTPHSLKLNSFSAEIFFKKIFLKKSGCSGVSSGFSWALVAAVAPQVWSVGGG